MPVRREQFEFRAAASLRAGSRGARLLAAVAAMLVARTLDRRRELAGERCSA
jgi:hypothetical protein